MGYRTYITVIEKNKVHNIRNAKTKNDLANIVKKDSTQIYDLFDSKKDFCLGKYIDYLEEHRQKHGSDVFISNELQEEYEENYVYETTKEGLEYFINRYHSSIEENYKKLLGDIEYILNNKDSITQNDIHEKLIDTTSHLFGMNQVWQTDYDDGIPYDLSKKQNKTIMSSFYEYAIFELVKMYKELDEDKETIVIFGW